MAAVLPIQQAYVAALRQGKTAEMTALAQKEDRASHAELNRLRALPCNSECFDCTASKPGWAVLPHGIFVCIDCAQVHRNLGRHISQTKAINTGTYLWYKHELAVMREVGNARAAQWYRAAPAKPSRDAPAADKEAYARDKYERRRWGPTQEAAPAPASAPPPAPRQVASASARPLVTWKDPVVERTVLSPITMPAKRSQSGGLAHAKRVPVATAPATTTTTMADLISLDEDADAMVAEPAASVSPDVQPAVGWATEWPDLWEAPSAAGAWDTKKAAVLSQFAWDTKKAAVLSQFAQTAANNGRTACGPSVGSPALFFASYGL